MSEPITPYGDDAAADPDAKYLQETLANGLRVVDLLAAAFPSARSTQQVADALTLNRDQAFRALKTLKSRDWVEETAAGWVVGRGLTLASYRVQRYLADLTNRYLTGIK